MKGCIFSHHDPIGFMLTFFKELASADNFQLYLLYVAMVYVKVYRDFSFFPETIGYSTWHQSVLLGRFFGCVYMQVVTVKLKIYITSLFWGWTWHFMFINFLILTCIIPSSNAHITYWSPFFASACGSRNARSANWRTIQRTREVGSS